MKRFRIAALSLALAFLTALGAAATASASTASSATAGRAVVATATAVTPGIRSQTCDAGTATFVHVYSTFHGTICYGFAGTIHPNVFAEFICAGNNIGSVTVTLPGGSPQTVSLPPPGTVGDFGSDHAFINSVTIDKWNGGATCP